MDTNDRVFVPWPLCVTFSYISRLSNDHPLPMYDFFLRHGREGNERRNLGFQGHQKTRFGAGPQKIWEARLRRAIARSQRKDEGLGDRSRRHEVSIVIFICIH